MKLSVFERLLVLSCLPKQGDLTTIRLVHDLRNLLSFSEDEHKALDFQINKETKEIKWQRDKDKPQEYALGEKSISIIRENLEQTIQILGDKKTVTEDHLIVLDKFNGGTNE